MSKTSGVGSVQASATRLARASLALCAAYAVFILGADAWNLVTRELTSQRWLMFGALLIISAVAWALARNAGRSSTYYRALICLMIFGQLALATFTIYTERGMSSRGVALFALPIASSVLLASRRAIYAVAALSTACYVMSATRYFYVYFNEGYKIELYSTLFLYSASFFVLAAILAVVVPRTSR
jgi:hypothetical protein